MYTLVELSQLNWAWIASYGFLPGVFSLHPSLPPSHPTFSPYSRHRSSLYELYSSGSHPAALLCPLQQLTAAAAVAAADCNYK